MNRKIITEIALVVSLLLSVSVFCGCKFGNREVVEPQYRIRLNEPDRIHLEYGNIVYVRDGDDVYGISPILRGEVYIRENLSSPAISVRYQGYDYEQYYISAFWSSYENGWIYANENYYEDPDFDDNTAYHANDDNYLTIYGFVNSKNGSAYYLSIGYWDVNTLTGEPAEDTGEQTLDIGGNLIECNTFQSVYDKDGIYLKTKLWYAKGSNIFVKKTVTTDPEEDIDSATPDVVATVYIEGQTMAEVLAERERTMPVFNLS